MNVNKQTSSETLTKYRLYYTRNDKEETLDFNTSQEALAYGALVRFKYITIIESFITKPNDAGRQKMK